MTVSRILALLRKELQPVAGAFALSEGERALEFFLGCSRADLYLSRNRELPPVLLPKIEALIRRRRTGEPLPYILGSVFFYEREFVVSPEALIPRPDTEMLIEEILSREPQSPRRFFDCGTGSGCIAATLTEARSEWRGVAADLSPAALRIAAKNCGERIALVCCDRFSAIGCSGTSCFDFIVANPPYIPTSILPTLDPSVRDFEPIMALDGGEDGLAFHRYLAEGASKILQRGGRLYAEIGYDQGPAVETILRDQGWNDIRIKKDLGGRDRVVRATV